MRKNLVSCPSCGGNLKISQYNCPSCGIDINGEFEGCMFCNLDDEDRYLALVFLQTGGNISDVEKVMGISYPTVKAKLAQLLTHLGVSMEGNIESNDQHRFGERFKSRHRLLEEMRRVKRKIKEQLKLDVPASAMGAIPSMKDLPFDIEQFMPDFASGSPEDETRHTRKVKAEVSSILSDLKDGKIDVSAALRRIRGEETGESIGKATNEGSGEGTSGFKIEVEGKIDTTSEESK